VSITITISGHTPDKDTEAQVIEAAKAVCATLRETGSEVYNASASTQHHGTVQLNVESEAADHDWTKAAGTPASDSQEGTTEGTTEGTGYIKDADPSQVS
jgi:hypothetical protein